MKSDGPNCSLQSLVLFLCPWKQSHDFVQPPFGAPWKKGAGDHPNTATPERHSSGHTTCWDAKLLFHCLGSLSCSDTEAPTGLALSLAHSQLGDSPEVPQGFCSVLAPHNLLLLGASFLGGKLGQIFSKSTHKHTGHLSWSDSDAKEISDFWQDNVK